MSKKNFDVLNCFSYLDDASEEDMQKICDVFEEEDEYRSYPEIRLSEREHELFFMLLNSLNMGGVPYGRAVINLALYACAVEDRVRSSMLN